MKALGITLALALALPAAPAAAAAQARFPHARHAALFDSCDQCHAGVATPDGQAFPAATFCAVCHDGQMQPRVGWTPREGPRPSTLRFTHAAHPPIGCEFCHNPEGGERMDVRLAVTDNCMTCHIDGAPHYQAPDGACTQCHVARKGAPRPATHAGGFRVLHGRDASARPATCAACHVRQDCLDCHRPNAASHARYHPPTFLSEHPVAAYARQTSCADCHNTAQFCSTCHQQAGLVVAADRRLQGAFHDGNPTFIAGHGPAARQSLETCVTCHVERDCLQCHAAIGAARINPHGPGFDAAKLRTKNAQMCAACHGANIPGGG